MGDTPWVLFKTSFETGLSLGAVSKRETEAETAELLERSKKSALMARNVLSHLGAIIALRNVTTQLLLQFDENQL